jgi:hypothetical protein
MNDSLTKMDETTEGKGKQESGSARDRRRRRRFLIWAGVALVLGLLAAGGIRRLAYVPPSAHGLYEWTLRFPGPSPGATFKTAPGDDIRGLLDILLDDTDADWNGELRKTGTIRIELSHVSAVPLGVRLLWRFWGPEGTPPPERIGRSLLVVEVRRVSSDSARYVLVKLDSDGREAVAGTFDAYASVEDAVLDDLAEVMETIQSEEAVGHNG